MTDQGPSLSAPYAHSARTYLDSKLGWPIPSAYPFEKMPPLKGWTGKRGGIPDLSRIDEWRSTYPNSNILLRLHPHVLGIDVDAYGKKKGATTLQRVTTMHGSLPPTYKSSARGPGVAGIYFFLLGGHYMDEQKLHGDFGANSDIEIIRFSHRYAVVYPSWHKGAEARYQWYYGQDEVGPPAIDDLAALPKSWFTHMTQRCQCFEEMRREQRAQLKRYQERPLSTQGGELAKLDFERGIQTLAAMPEGGRNNYLSKLAGRTLLFDVMLNGVLTDEFVTSKLWLAADTCGLDTTETQRTIESAVEWAAKIAEENE